MLLVMRQAETIHTMSKYDLKIADDEKSRENIHVYVFPTPGAPIDSPSLTLRVDNRGEYLVRIVRIWYNDENIEVDYSIQGLSQVEFAPFDVPDIETCFKIKVTTDRGNEFASDSGTIRYIGGGEWETGMLMINVLIYYEPGGNYKIEVRQGDELGDNIIGSPYLLHKSSGSAFTYFDVSYLDSPNTYHVKIARGSDVIYDDPVTIDWPLGPPVAWVFA